MSNSSNNSLTIEESEQFHSTTFIIALMMLVFCIIGAYGNLISIIVFSHRTMKAPINVLLKALSLIDTILILSTVLVFIIPNLNLTFQNADLRFACEFASLYVYPISMTAQTCSVWTFVLVSLERYLAVVQPLKRHKLLTCRQARGAQLILLVTALCYNLIRFWEYERTNYNHTDLAPIQPLLRFQTWYFLFYYVILYIITHFLVPFGVILILNAYIVYALRNSQETSTNSSVSSVSNNGKNNNNPKNRKNNLAQCRLRKFSRRQIRQRKTTQMIVVITLMFAICNTLPFLINIVEAFDESLFYGPWNLAAYIALDISNILVVFNSSTTFIIYIFYCSKYRILFLRYGLGNLFVVRKQRQTLQRRKKSETSGYFERTTEYCSVGTLEDAEISVV